MGFGEVKLHAAPYYRNCTDQGFYESRFAGTVRAQNGPVFIRIYSPGRVLQKKSFTQTYGNVIESYEWFGSHLNSVNPQISQITQITMNIWWRLRNLPGLIARSLLRLDRIYHTLIFYGLPRGSSFVFLFSCFWAGIIMIVNLPSRQAISSISPGKPDQ
jgi:hypothetical protein